MFWRKRLSFQINIGPEIDNLPNDPSERHPNYPAQNSHRPSLGKEEFLHITIARTDGFHDADLAASLENRHHQRIHDPNRSNDQRKAAEDSQKCVKRSEELSQPAAGVEN